MKIEESLIKGGTTVGVALSGGRDSASLFHYLLKNAKRLDISVVAINVEHGIRESSKRETELIREHCKKLCVPVKVYGVDAPAHAKLNKKTIEQSARELRYECFEDAIKQGFCDVVVTAHHREDDVETVLMRLFRGTGARGLAGIGERRGNILRPMLETSREEIDEYCRIEGVAYFEDETNLDESYTRNFLRRSVLPLIREKYPNVDKALLRLARTSAIDEEHFRRLRVDKVKDIGFGAVGVDISALSDEAVAVRVIQESFSALGVDADVEERHFRLLRELTLSENGTTLDMPRFVRAYKEYDRIAFDRLDGVDNLEKEAVLGIDYLLYGEKYCLELVTQMTKGGLFVDEDKIKGAVVRTRKEGDTFKRFGGGRKSLGDYFTDIKLPVRLRDKVAVLARGSEILAVFGIEISENAKIDQSTDKIIQLHGGKNVFRRS